MPGQSAQCLASQGDWRAYHLQDERVCGSVCAGHGGIMILEKQRILNDVVMDVMEAMSPDQKEYLKQLRKEDLINEHFGFSLWVRNQLFNMPFQPNEVDVYQPTHMDDISSKITEMLWEKLQLNSNIY